jgi:ferrous iron transport protein B
MSEKIAIVGNPNVGKSQLFNRLGGIYSIVANYPHTTVEPVKTPLTLHGKTYELIDSPGINSISAHSEEELSTRDVIIKEGTVAIIQCLDAANIERSLLLTSQLAELGIPLLLTLNIMDETQQRGIWIDAGRLERILGIPVVEIIAEANKGIQELIERLEQQIAKPVVTHTGCNYKTVIEDGLVKLRACFNGDPPSKAVLLLLLSMDKDIAAWVKEKYGDDLSSLVEESVRETRRTTSKNIASIISSDRRDWVQTVIEGVIKTSKVSTTSVADKIGRLTRHPVWGWPILAGVIYITYLLVGRLAANTIVELIEKKIFYPLYALIADNISSKFLADFLVGDYGILSTGLGNALATALPILFMFFLILNFMEDSGYFVNLCILVSRFTRQLGLSGQSVLPLLLGFGCKTMATLTTKILDSRKERYIAIFLIAFAIPCSPQMGLIMGILGSFSFSAFFVVFGVLVIVEFMAGVILNRIIKDEIVTDFILEIPPTRMPGIKNLFVKLYHRMKWFMKEVPHLFMLGAFLLFVLDKSGGLLFIKKVATPIIVTFLSLPIETVDAFLLCLAKHEAGAVLLFTLAEKNLLSYTQIVVSLIIITSLGPCFANLMAIIKQIGLASALVMRVVILIASILTGGVVNWMLRLGQKLIF